MVDEVGTVTAPINTCYPKYQSAKNPQWTAKYDQGKTLTEWLITTDARSGLATRPHHHEPDGAQVLTEDPRKHAQLAVVVANTYRCGDRLLVSVQ